MKKWISICGALLLCPLAAYGASLVVHREIQDPGYERECGIAKVDDGDTFDLQCGDDYFPDVRLLGVNAPDKDQKTSYEHCYYDDAKTAIGSIGSRALKVSFHGSDLCKDPYKGCRNLVMITDVNTGKDLGKTLIEKGYAFSWTQFSVIGNDTRLLYIRAEAQARKSGYGLWNACRVKYAQGTSADSGVPNKMTY